MPSMKALRKLALKLGVSPDYLETGEEASLSERWELLLADCELTLRLGEPPADFVSQLESILNAATAAGEIAIATRARLCLGAYASHRGNHANAVTLLEDALEQPWVSPLANPEAYVTLGHSLAATDRPQQAVVLFRDCLEELELHQPPPASTITRFATQLSYALTELGDIEGAQAAVLLALRYGRSARDPYTRVRLYWSTARVASVAGDFELARRSINHAIVLLAETEDALHLARAHLLAAEIALSSDELEQAGAHLADAEQTLPPGASLQDQAFLVVQQAFCAARSGRAAAAMDYATTAIARLGEHEDPAIRGAAHWALAEAYAAAGAHHAAREAFACANALIPPGHKDAQRLLAAWERATTLAQSDS